jgi:alanyl-tRNA synthetase
MGSSYSVELCGGTHVKRTGDIGLFKITGESAIAAGIRRIEAVTAQYALDYINAREATLENIAASLKISVDEVGTRIEGLLNERKKLEKDLAAARKNAAMGGSGNSDIAQEEINGIAVIGKNFGDVPPKDLRELAGNLQKKIGSGVVAVGSSFEGKGSIIVAVSDDLTNKVNAVTLVQISAEILGAKGGGGKPNFAQTGGTNGDKVEDAIALIRNGLAA